MINIAKRIARKVLPSSTQNAIHGVLREQRRRRYVRALEGKRFSPRENGVFVHYGGVIPKGPGAIVSGGRVKLLALEREFPENDERFNILYLVSSALPPFALELVQWAKRMGVKLIWNQNGVAYPAWANATVQEETNRPMREIIKQADYVLYQSGFCLDSANRYLAPVSVPWEIVYNYADTAAFTPAAAPPDMRTWRLLSAGSHQKRHRITSLLDTVAELKRRGRSVRLAIAGKLEWPDTDDPVRETLEEIDKRGVAGEVFLHDSFTREQAPSMYQDAHVLLHTKYNDPCPTVTIEAMACGVPVVASGSGGTKEQVTRGAGVSIDLPENWERDIAVAGSDVADAVETIMPDWSAYSAGARAVAVERFDQRVWIEKHKEIFNTLVQG